MTTMLISLSLLYIPCLLMLFSFPFIIFPFPSPSVFPPWSFLSMVLLKHTVSYSSISPRFSQSVRLFPFLNPLTISPYCHSSSWDEIINDRTGNLIQINMETGPYEHSSSFVCHNSTNSAHKWEGRIRPFAPARQYTYTGESGCATYCYYKQLLSCLGSVVLPQSSTPPLLGAQMSAWLLGLCHHQTQLAVPASQIYYLIN